MDEGDGDASPWASDDWEPAEQPPVEFAQPPGTGAGSAPAAPPAPGAPADDALAWRGDVAGEDRTGERPSSAPGPRALVIGGALALGVLAIAAFAVGGSSSDGDATEDSTSATSAPDATAPESTSPRTTVVRTTVPNTVSVVVHGDPQLAVGVSGLTVESGSLVEVSFEQVASPSFTAAVPKISELELGKVPRWTEWSIPTVGPVATMAPTEVVFIDGRELHRVQFPSGIVRSVAFPTELPIDSNLAVSDDAIVLASRDSLVVVRDGVPAVAHEIGGTVNSIHARPGTGDFLVWLQTRDEMGGSELVLFGVDGNVTPISHPRVTRMWPGGMALGPSGELFFSDIGGTYGYDPATGVVRRVSDGSMHGIGSNHALVQRCDESFTCRVELVELATWTAVPVPLLFDEFVFGFDSRLSPTGSHLSVVAYAQNGPNSYLYDVATGTAIDDERALEIAGWMDLGTWAPDGSGMFGGSGTRSLVFRSVDGTQTELNGLGPTSLVVVRSAE